MQNEQSDKASDYRVYTTKFDRVVDANDLDSVLGPLEVYDQGKLEEAWNELQSGLLPWKTRLHIASSELADLGLFGKLEPVGDVAEATIRSSHVKAELLSGSSPSPQRKALVPRKVFADK